MFKKVAIEQLSVGMYVEAVAESKAGGSATKVIQKGIIKSTETIEKLGKLGISSLIIDTAKSIGDNQQPTTHPAASPRVKKTRSFSDKLNDAQAMYLRAKELQAQAMDNIYEGKSLNLEGFVELSDEFVDSLFDDPDALLCVSMMKNKDDYLLEHSINVALLLGAFAGYLKMPEKDVKSLILGGFLHDIGKVKIADEILKKPGRLTPEEYQVMQRHVEYGEAAVEGLQGLPDIARQVMLQHHEKLNGNGYPRGLDKDSISLYGKMAAIADCYDAITSTRCYKDGEVSGRAFKILLNDSGSHFDAGLVGKFIKCIGVYPVGTVVALKSGRLGIVLRRNKQNPLRPLVRVFYNLRHKHYIEAKEVDLSRAYEDDEIEKSMRGESLDIDVPKYFKEFLFS
ncbi:HD-GYP domain-containing protein [Pleionea litopenaei]|uniref:HD-GYP domain-containing protein n=1 Tax=Pleionea litopenaei TaxID=3070815 RepID=A0AA51RVM6_9GAMM|nr:HD-GYP domain-containing protein [Pleionea sp. HL-JVS1]WMS88340.1 HD-GYP domain-containing protein [Pleionea sp. HL-JVS1]